MIYKNSINCARCQDFMAGMPLECIDLTVTSPPYGDLRQYDDFSPEDFNFLEIARQLYRVTKPGGVVCWVVGDCVKNYGEQLIPQRQQIHFVDQVGFICLDTMIFQKLNYLPQNDGIRYEQAFEYIIVLSKGRPKTFNPILKKNKEAGRQKHAAKRLFGSEKEKGTKGAWKKDLTINEYGARGNVWPYAVGAGNSATDKIAFQHTAIFPELLAYDLIRSWSNPGDLALDPFGGSGTVGKAAATLGRNFILIDISEKYCSIMRRRIGELMVQRERVVL